MGDTVMVSSGLKVFMRVMHIRRGLPLISALHEPHLPALQFQRQARSPACVAWRVWMTSRTTMPSWASTLYSLNAPLFASARHTRIVTIEAPTTIAEVVVEARLLPPPPARGGRGARPPPLAPAAPAEPPGPWGFFDLGRGGRPRPAGKNIQRGKASPPRGVRPGAPPPPFPPP